MAADTDDIEESKSGEDDEVSPFKIILVIYLCLLSVGAIVGINQREAVAVSMIMDDIFVHIDRHKAPFAFSFRSFTCPQQETYYVIETKKIEMPGVTPGNRAAERLIAELSTDFSRISYILESKEVLAAFLGGSSAGITWKNVASFRASQLKSMFMPRSSRSGVTSAFKRAAMYLVAIVSGYYIGREAGQHINNSCDDDLAVRYLSNADFWSDMTRLYSFAMVDRLTKLDSDLFSVFSAEYRSTKEESFRRGISTKCKHPIPKKIVSEILNDKKPISYQDLTILSAEVLKYGNACSSDLLTFSSIAINAKYSPSDLLGFSGIDKAIFGGFVPITCAERLRGHEEKWCKHLAQLTDIETLSEHLETCGVVAKLLQKNESYESIIHKIWEIPPKELNEFDREAFLFSYSMEKCTVEISNTIKYLRSKYQNHSQILDQISSFTIPDWPTKISRAAE